MRSRRGRRISYYIRRFGFEDQEERLGTVVGPVEANPPGCIEENFLNRKCVRQKTPTESTQSHRDEDINQEIEWGGQGTQMKTQWMPNEFNSMSKFL